MSHHLSRPLPLLHLRQLLIAGLPAVKDPRIEGCSPRGVSSHGGQEDQSASWKAIFEDYCNVAAAALHSPPLSPETWLASSSVDLQPDVGLGWASGSMLTSGGHAGNWHCGLWAH